MPSTGKITAIARQIENGLCRKQALLPRKSAIEVSYLATERDCVRRSNRWNTLKRASDYSYYKTARNALGAWLISKAIFPDLTKAFLLHSI